AKADQAPELRQVPQMLAAGWGGTGSIAPPPMPDAVMICESAGPFDSGPKFSRPQLKKRACLSPVSDADMEYLDIPAFLMRQADDGDKVSSSDSRPQKSSGRTRVRFLDSLARAGSKKSNHKQRDTRSIDQLPGLPFSVLDELKAQGISVIQDLLERSEHDLLALGLDPEDTALIVAVLAQMQLHLRSG
ncbi:MAG: hypothetical protein HQL47_07410, partial [Gammaproteobacteria bacterium]|nr:hypothetical protein [Gammaproteobacteria bacterium]